MKKRILGMVSLMVLAVLASTRVAQAQQSLLVNIPFDFVAGNQTLPAGQYAVSVASVGHSLLLVDRKDGIASAFLITNAVAANEIQTESKLIFNRYGDRYFLSKVWTEGNSRGRELLKSAREKEMAQTAKNETQGQVTLVAELTRTTR